MNLDQPKIPVAEECDLNPVVRGTYNWGDHLNTTVEVKSDGSAVIIQGDRTICLDSLGFFRDVTKVFELAIRAMPNNDLSSTLLCKSLGTSRSLPVCDYD